MSKADEMANYRAGKKLAELGITLMGDAIDQMEAGILRTAASSGEEAESSPRVLEMAHVWLELRTLERQLASLQAWRTWVDEKLAALEPGPQSPNTGGPCLQDVGGMWTMPCPSCGQELLLTLTVSPKGLSVETRRTVPRETPTS